MHGAHIARADRKRDSSDRRGLDARGRDRKSRLVIW
jgi:hypothetical protein